MSEKYQKAYEQYLEAAARAKKGDAKAMADKAAAMNDLRAMEREAARGGTALNPVVKAGKVSVRASEVPAKRSLQEEYVRSFDEKTPVEIGRGDGQEFKGTLRDYHTKRLLGK